MSPGMFSESPARGMEKNKHLQTEEVRGVHGATRVDARAAIH